MSVCVCVCVCVVWVVKKRKGGGGGREGRKGKCEGREAFVGVISERPTKHPCMLCLITAAVCPFRNCGFSV